MLARACRELGRPVPREVRTQAAVQIEEADPGVQAPVRSPVVPVPGLPAVDLSATERDLGDHALVQTLVRQFVADWDGQLGSLAVAVETGLFSGPRLFPSGRGLARPGGQGDFRAAGGKYVWIANLDNLGAAYLASGHEEAPRLFERVRAELDAYTNAWVSMHEESCRATYVRHEQPEAEFEQGMRCLQRHHGRLRATIDALNSPLCVLDANGELVNVINTPANETRLSIQGNADGGGNAIDGSAFLPGGGIGPTLAPGGVTQTPPAAMGVPPRPNGPGERRGQPPAMPEGTDPGGQVRSTD